MAQLIATIQPSKELFSNLKLTDWPYGRKAVSMKRPYPYESMVTEMYQETTPQEKAGLPVTMIFSGGLSTEHSGLMTSKQGVSTPTLKPELIYTHKMLGVPNSASTLLPRLGSTIIVALSLSLLLIGLAYLLTFGMLLP